MEVVEDDVRLGQVLPTAPLYAGDMSMATALILALLPLTSLSDPTDVVDGAKGVG